MKRLVYIVVFATCVGMAVAERGTFTSVVNMEKLYTLEDELIALSDVILNQERSLHGLDDTHGIYNISSIIAKVKRIHRELVTNRNLSSYIVHPINMYHMTKRLVKDWTKVIATLENSQSCARVMRIKVENIADNMPSGRNLKHIVEAILRLQAYYRFSVVDVMSGTLSTRPALSPLSLNDAFEFARIAYETSKYYLCVDWLKLVMSLYDEDVASFTLSNAMNFMSSAYFNLHRPRDALSTLEDLLKKDPNNVVAKRNSVFIAKKIEEGLAEEVVDHQILRRKKDALLQKYCNSSVRLHKSTSAQYCTYTSTRNPSYFEKPSIQTEVLSLKPLIVLYRNFTNASQQKAVVNLGHEQMKAIMYKNHYTHPDGMAGLSVEDKTFWQWIPSLQRTLDNIHISHRKPAASQFIVRNIGLEGAENTALDQAERSRLGTYVVFLSEPSNGGGDIVFPFAKTKVSPEKGTVLFYERTVHKQATFCPVIADTQWVGIYPLQDQLHNDVCYKDILNRPTPQ